MNGNHFASAIFGCIAAFGIVVATPALGQGKGRAGQPKPPPATTTAPGDVIQDRTRDRDRNRVDVPDQDQTRDQDRLRDRDPLFLGSRDRLQTFDRDRDGSINRVEFRQWQESAFDTIDANGDGGFNLAEFQAVRLGPGPNSDSPGARRQRNDERAQMRKAERFRVMDGDGNGAVTRTEYMKFGELNFLEADANDDHRLTFEEMQQFHRDW